MKQKAMVLKLRGVVCVAAIMIAATFPVLAQNNAGASGAGSRDIAVKK
jgi:hypothetical protein